jgi:arabinan endo-1,5-alpha-L-arabinosidase
MLEGHAEVVLDAGTDPNGRYVGPGSVAVLSKGERTVIAYHAYDTQRNGAPTLRIRPITWGSDGWPEVQ